jgi:hypothetical protein
MSKDQMKYEINKVLDLLPDKALEELLTFLQKESKSGNLFLDNSRLKKILAEDIELLQKLAQ